MTSIEQSKKWQINLLIWAAFFLPFFQTATFICWVFCFIIQLSQDQLRSKLIRNVFQWKIHLVLPLFYFMHILGLIWTDNFSYAGKDLETKASLFIVPLFFSAIALRKDEVRSICIAFVFSCFLTGLFLFFLASFAFFKDGDLAHFSYVEFSSAVMHPTYLSFYFSMASIILLVELVVNLNSKKTILYQILFLMIWIFQFMLYARTALISGIIVFIISSIYLIKNHQLKFLGFFRFSVIITISGVIVFLFMQPKNRFIQVDEALINSADKKIAFNSTTGRIEIWKEGWELFLKDPLLGVGTGDVKDELVSTYRKHDFSYGYDNKLNAHNQVLQTGIALGTFGIIFILIMMIVPLLYQSSVIELSFILIVFMNMMTESILEVQKGVIFFVFFWVLFFVAPFHESKTITI